MLNIIEGLSKNMAAVDYFALKFSVKYSSTQRSCLMLCSVLGSKAELLRHKYVATMYVIMKLCSNDAFDNFANRRDRTIWTDVSRIIKIRARFRYRGNNRCFPEFREIAGINNGIS